MPASQACLIGAVERVRRRGVDDDRVIALQDQVLDLRRLGRHFLVGGGEHVGGGDDLVGDRLLGDDVVAVQHRLAPGIAGVIVGEGDLLAAGVGKRRARREHRGKRAQDEKLLHSTPPVGSSHTLRRHLLPAFLSSASAPMSPGLRPAAIPNSHLQLRGVETSASPTNQTNTIPRLVQGLLPGGIAISGPAGRFDLEKLAVLRDVAMRHAANLSTRTRRRALIFLV